MPAALEGVAADVSVPAARRTAAVPAFLAASGLVLAVAVLAGGGSSDARLAWIGGAALAVAGVGAAALPRPGPGRAGLALTAALVAWVAWGGVAIAWSIEPDRSWDVVNRGLAYVALFALGLLAGAASRRPASLTAAALAGIFGAATLWALAGKVVPALGPDVDRSARLESPIGYWNALALLVAMSLPLWCWLGAARARSGVRRAAAAAAIALSVVALALTSSRGGVLVAAVAVAAWLALAPQRRESAFLLAAGGVSGLAVAAWALTRPALTDAGVASRGRDGAVLGVLLAAAAAAAAAGARLPAPGRRLAVALAAGALVLALGGAVGVTVAVGGPRELVDRFCAAGDATNEPGRLATFSSNNRCTWWREAAEIWRDHPVGGTGAGTFATARKPIRDGPASPVEPHNLPLRALAETGLVGFALLLGAIAAAGAVAVGALRRLEGEERLAAAALVAGAVAFLAHSLVDMGFEFVAVTAPVLVSLGVLAGAGARRARARVTPLTSIALAGMALAAVLSLASPRLAERRADAALDTLLAGDAREAVSLAGDAQALNPLAVRPLHVEALAQQRLRRLDEAGRLYVEAVELQPENPETWYRLGVFELDVRGDAAAALRALDRSWALDPFGGAQHRLEEARARAAAQP